MGISEKVHYFYYIFAEIQGRKSMLKILNTQHVQKQASYLRNIFAICDEVLKRCQVHYRQQILGTFWPFVNVPDKVHCI